MTTLAEMTRKRREYVEASKKAEADDAKKSNDGSRDKAVRLKLQQGKIARTRTSPNAGRSNSAPQPPKRAVAKPTERPRSQTPRRQDLAMKRAEIRRDRTVAAGKKFLSDVGSGIAENFAKLKEAAPGFIAERNKRFGENLSSIGKAIKTEVDRATVRDPPKAAAIEPKSAPNTSTQIPANKGDNSGNRQPIKATATPAKAAAKSNGSAKKAVSGAAKKGAAGAASNDYKLPSVSYSYQVKGSPEVRGSSAKPTYSPNTGSHAPRVEARLMPRKLIPDGSSEAPKKATAYTAPPPSVRKPQEGVGAWRARTTAGRERDRRD